MKTEEIIERKEKLALKKAVLEKREKLLREKERKIRLRKLIRLGDLVSKAKIDSLSENALFGAFLELQENSQNAPILNKWEIRGAKAFEADERSNPQQLVISFKEESPDAKILLKEKQFKRNSFRKEWYGYGKKEELEELLKGYNVTIEVISLQN
jgi:hypothetical protein